MPPAASDRKILSHNWAADRNHYHLGNARPTIEHAKLFHKHAPNGFE